MSWIKIECTEVLLLQVHLHVTWCISNLVQVWFNCRCVLWLYPLTGSETSITWLTPFKGWIQGLQSGLRVWELMNPAFDDRLRLCSINMLTLSCIAAASSNVSGRLWLRVVGSKQSKFVINIEIIEIVGGWYSKTINEGVITPPKPAIELEMSH